MLIKLFATLSYLAKYVLDIIQFTFSVPTWFKKLVSYVISCDGRYFSLHAGEFSGH